MNTNTNYFVAVGVRKLNDCYVVWMASGSTKSNDHDFYGSKKHGKFTYTSLVCTKSAFFGALNCVQKMFPFLLFQLTASFSEDKGNINWEFA